MSTSRFELEEELVYLCRFFAARICTVTSDRCMDSGVQPTYMPTFEQSNLEPVP
jgi:hypothetical protein